MEAHPSRPKPPQPFAEAVRHPLWPAKPYFCSLTAGGIRSQSLSRQPATGPTMQVQINPRTGRAQGFQPSHERIMSGICHAVVNISPNLILASRIQ